MENEATFNSNDYLELHNINYSYNSKYIQAKIKDVVISGLNNYLAVTLSNDRVCIIRLPTMSDRTKQTKKLKLKLQTMIGDIYEMEIEEFDPIIVVKKKFKEIWKGENFELDELNLFLGNKLLKEHITVHDYSITSDISLTVTIYKPTEE